MAFITQEKVGSTTYDLCAAALIYGECSTGASTVAKTATATGSATFSLQTGSRVSIKFTNSNTAADPTLNVNSTGAKPIKKYGTEAVGTSETTSWPAGAVITFTYDGTNWVMNDYVGGSQVQIVRW